MRAEQVDQPDLAALVVEETIILGNGAGRQRAAVLRDALDLPAQRDLLGQESGASLAVLRAFARETHLVFRRQFLRRLKLVLRWQCRDIAHLPVPLAPGFLGVAANRHLRFVNL